MQELVITITIHHLDMADIVYPKIQNNYLLIIKKIPQEMMQAIVKSNETRITFS